MLLVHICCSVDSHFFLQKLQKLYPLKKLIGYFYDPNIHPFSEYQLRLFDVKRSCQKLGIELIEGAYDYEGWMQAVRGLENEPEKGKRCSICFDDRLEKTAQKAIELGISEITTTLLTSPKKSIEQLRMNAKSIEEKYALHVHTPDFRVGGGTSEQFALAKKDKLYHQNYCGCLFALESQRQNQQRLADELMSALGRQILPSSIEERLKLYESVLECEEKGKDFTLKREKFLNYRLLRAYVKDEKKEVIPSYFLFYSWLKREHIKGSIELEEKGIGYLNKEEIVFVSLDKVNEVLQTRYKNVKELCLKALSVAQEISLRKKVIPSEFLTLNPIIIVDEIALKKYEIYLKSVTYTDTREKLYIQ